MWQATHWLPGLSVLWRVCVFKPRDARTIRSVRCVTIETDRCRWLSELSVVLRAVHVVTRGARDAAAIHHTLDEIVALHAVLVRGAVSVMREASFLRECVVSSFQ